MNEVKCINKIDRQNAWERITHVWWVTSDWKNWKITQQEAVEWIETWKRKFFVKVKGSSVNVIVAKSRFGNKYIKTESDWEEPNNLLSLMECK
jgi:hypothetical protein